MGGERAERCWHEDYSRQNYLRIPILSEFHGSTFYKAQYPSAGVTIVLYYQPE